MLPVKVNLKDNSYDILIGVDILADLGEILKSLSIGKDAIVITNPVIKRLHGKALTKSLKKSGFNVDFFEVPSGERSKSANSAFKLIEKIAQKDVNRQNFIIAFGGGVVGDLAGYIAASYKRGIPYIQVPTTFLAQIDSAIGGKVAVDLPIGKNLIGAFYQPKLVLSDVRLLATLDKRQIRNGLSEAVKYGIICDKNLFAFIEANSKKLLSLDKKALMEVVLNCSRIKAKVVMSDEKETKGIRTILNFGHTIGHAIEAANKFNDYHHGEAVALGMRVAADLSRRLKLINSTQVSRINELLTDIGLPKKIKKVKIAQIIKYMEHDKKFKGKKNRFVLTTGLGNVKVAEGIKNRLILASIKSCM